ncbi:hypothetical protein [Novacetimonas hansenii]|uniref:Uncharacterized protein n=1 Tax=Novacetimonas hansenii TaxID=436 RepID=A0ABQ0SH82_NOVHA|nr:hypothetical protein [Novacetimonas hansenii]GAN84023.1 hypothetical protein Gaha_0122_023 [Novacetimonas hansenii JCM 7643]GBQ55790.1 hypothetical protein AA0243_1011 [Novacetimonas hansenii NRIC 0243]GEC64603.1 hypothetical protein GHA01_24520 [Novacetimonas hansenii]
MLNEIQIGFANYIEEYIISELEERLSYILSEIYQNSEEEIEEYLLNEIVQEEVLYTTERLVNNEECKKLICNVAETAKKQIESCCKQYVKNLNFEETILEIKANEPKEIDVDIIIHCQEEFGEWLKGSDSRTSISLLEKYVSYSAMVEYVCEGLHEESETYEHLLKKQGFVDLIFEYNGWKLFILFATEEGYNIYNKPE